MSAMFDLNTGVVEYSNLPAMDLARVCHGARYDRPFHEEMITITTDHIGVRDLVIVYNEHGATAHKLARFAAGVRAYYSKRGVR